MAKAADRVEGETDALGVTIPETADDARPYIKMIKDALRVEEGWQRACDDIEKLYGQCDELASSGRDRRFQIFYANVEVLKNVVYSRPPKPTAVGRFNDRRPIIRTASEMLERVSTTSFELNKVHEEVLTHCRDNVVLFGRGVPWLRYYAKKTAKGFNERVPWEWVHRRDFLHDPARCWYDVQWVARRRFYTEKQGKKRFNVNQREDGRDASGRFSRDRWTDITYTRQPNDRDGEYKFQQKAEVWELWNKETGEVLWIHLDKDELLDKRKPGEVLADLDNFFPCPRPAYGSREPDTLKPIPDVLQYKDQIEEIWALTRRMASLTAQLKLKGYYPSGIEELGRAIERLFETEDDDGLILEGLNNFAALGGGTLKDSVIWIPIADIITTLQGCVAERRNLINDVYEISGISDIMRGQVDPDEKLGQTEMKGQYGSVRIREKQGEIVRLADDMLAMQAEVIAEQFQPQTLLEMSQMHDLPRFQQVQQQVDQKKAQLAAAQQAIAAAAAQAQTQPQPGMAPPGGPAPAQPPMQPPMAKPTASAQPPAPAGPDPQAMIGKLQAEIAELEQTVTFEAVLALFREQRIRPFMLKVATDSTIAPDENAEKRQRTEFVAALGQLLPQLAQMIQMNPGSVDFAIEILKFATAPYRAGRELEGSIDDFSENVKQQASQPKPPSPEEIKAQGEAKRIEADVKGKELEQAGRQQEMQARAAETSRKAALDEQKAQREAQAAADERAFKLRELELQAAENQAKRLHDQEMAKIALATKQADLRLKEMDLELKARDIEIAKHRVEEAKHPRPNGKGDDHVR